MAVQPYQTQTLPLYNCDCVVESYGNPNGETIIALHGWLDNLATFEYMLEHFSAFRFISIDLPGHGKSSHWSSDCPYSYYEFLPVILDLYSKLKIENAVLLGHSMGGGLAGYFSACFPKKVSKLIALDALGSAPLKAESPTAQLRRAIERRLISGSAKRVIPSQQEAVALRAKVNHVGVDVIRPIVHRGTKPEGKGFVWASDSRLLLPSMIRLGEEQVQKFLSEIECPTLLVHADNGIYRDRAKLEQRAACVKNIKFTTVQGSHYVHLEKPAQIAQEILGFLEIGV